MEEGWARPQAEPSSGLARTQMQGCPINKHASVTICNIDLMEELLGVRK